MARLSGWLVAAAGLALLAGGVAWSHRRAERHLRELASATRALSVCMLGEAGQAGHAGPAADAFAEALARRLSLSAPGAAALASCSPHAAAVEAARGALASAIHPARGLAAGLAAPSQRLLSAPLDAPALELHRDASALGAALFELSSRMCIQMHDAAAPGCAAAAAVAAQRARVVLERQAGDGAWAVSAEGERLTITAALAGGEALVAQGTRDTFEVATLEGKAKGRERAPVEVGEGDHRAFLRRSAEGPFFASVQRVDRQRATVEATIEPLAEGVSLAPFGEVVWAGGWAALVSIGGEAKVLYLDDQAHPRPLPPGRLLGGFSDRGAHALLERTSGKGFVDVVALPVPAKNEPVRDGVKGTAAYVADASPVDGPAMRCGLPGERHATTVMTGPGDAVLVAASRGAVYPYRFVMPERATAEVLCGTCPPMALTASGEGLAVQVPVRRSLSPTRIDAPIAFDRASSPSTATATCTPSRLVAAFVAGRRVIVQERAAGGWRFGEGVVMAEADEQGEPVEPSLVASGERVLLFFRRARPGAMRIEMVEVAPR